MKKTILAVLLLAVSTSNAAVDAGYTHDRGRVYADVQDKYTTVKYVRSDGTTSQTKYEFNCGRAAYRKVGSQHWERFESHLSAAYLGYKTTCNVKQLTMVKVESYPTAEEYHWRQASPSRRVLNTMTWDHPAVGTYGPDIDIIHQ